MNRYNSYMNNHFSGFQTLVEGYDKHREREVVVKAIPGDFTIVGITDGVDAWIAPISVQPSELFDRVRKAMAAYQAGQPIVTTSPLRRRPLHLPSPEPTTATIRRR